MNAVLAAWFSPPDMLLLLVIGVLLFGRRLPEVGRYLGKGLVEFKKGMKGLEDDVEVNSPPQVQTNQPREQPRPSPKVPATTPKFEDTSTNFMAPPKA